MKSTRETLRVIADALYISIAITGTIVFILLSVNYLKVG